MHDQKGLIQRLIQSKDTKGAQFYLLPNQLPVNCKFILQSNDSVCLPCDKLPNFATDIPNFWKQTKQKLTCVLVKSKCNILTYKSSYTMPQD